VEIAPLESRSMTVINGAWAREAEKVLLLFQMKVHSMANTRYSSYIAIKEAFSFIEERELEITALITPPALETSEVVEHKLTL